jgi:hypothetical protein
MYLYFPDTPRNYFDKTLEGGLRSSGLLRIADS